MKNNNVNKILYELKFNEKEKQIFYDSMQKIKLAQINDSIDAKAYIYNMIKGEFK